MDGPGARAGRRRAPRSARLVHAHVSTHAFRYIHGYWRLRLLRAWIKELEFKICGVYFQHSPHALKPTLMRGIRLPYLPSPWLATVFNPGDLRVFFFNSRTLPIGRRARVRVVQLGRCPIDPNCLNSRFVIPILWLMLGHTR